MIKVGDQLDSLKKLGGNRTTSNDEQPPQVTDSNTNLFSN